LEATAAVAVAASEAAAAASEATAAVAAAALEATAAVAAAPMAATMGPARVIARGSVQRELAAAEKAQVAGWARE